ncbi:hypothetical protein SAMN05421839_10439 [Halolactibacillus halophilus]|uniref:Uncharacterized protein n=1 Tax=Halolactibacillus halophilus TaxID=306540 RepID=A0A1I5M5E9_9BACI|nr:DUF5327 family protein [Halolactibacillus halophilus]GEM01021.1 hypothetical protein HHA03_05530 [Halolactibacillus halophilus]SFP04834.1 hypothetical protein SAMN05421839_10439 [Halolactibacillus halophilus]
MINTDDVIRKIITQAQSALNETNEKKKVAYLYSIQTLAELASDGDSGTTQVNSQPQPNQTPNVTNAQAEALELQMMMGDTYQPNPSSSVKTNEDDQFEQGSGSLLDF